MFYHILVNKVEYKPWNVICWHQMAAMFSNVFVFEFVTTEGVWSLSRKHLLISQGRKYAQWETAFRLVYMNIICVFVPSVWNDFPSELMNSDISRQGFKSCFKSCLFEQSYLWRRSAVVSTLAWINVVNQHWAWLVLEWVTVCGRVNHLGM